MIKNYSYSIENRPEKLSTSTLTKYDDSPTKQDTTSRDMMTNPLSPQHPLQRRGSRQQQNVVSANIDRQFCRCLGVGEQVAEVLFGTCAGEEEEPVNQIPDEIIPIPASHPLRQRGFLTFDAPAHGVNFSSSGRPLRAGRALFLANEWDILPVRLELFPTGMRFRILGESIRKEKDLQDQDDRRKKVENDENSFPVGQEISLGFSPFILVRNCRFESDDPDDKMETYKIFKVSWYGLGLCYYFALDVEFCCAARRGSRTSSASGGVRGGSVSLVEGTSRSALGATIDGSVASFSSEATPRLLQLLPDTDTAATRAKEPSSSGPAVPPHKTPETSRSKWVLDVSRCIRQLTLSLFPPFSIRCDPLPHRETTSRRLMAGFLVYLLPNQKEMVTVVYAELHAHVHKVLVDGEEEGMVASPDNRAKTSTTSTVTGATAAALAAGAVVGAAATTLGRGGASTTSGAEDLQEDDTGDEGTRASSSSSHRTSEARLPRSSPPKRRMQKVEHVYEAALLLYGNDKCERVLREICIREETPCFEKVGINCTAFCVDHMHQLSARTISEKKLWLRALANTKVKLQNKAPTPSWLELEAYREAVKETVRQDNHNAATLGGGSSASAGSFHLPADAADATIYEDAAVAQQLPSSSNDDFMMPLLPTSNRKPEEFFASRASFRSP
ncbi:unnamed protein product [Amoebophrya sp. A25]|nr:unnamed protein product [Amoebophrya sp. A25]|eukprot:GSA25T00025893001.1